MKRGFVRLLSILLVICLSLAIAPTALMEETIEPQAEAIEEATLMPVEENMTEPSENMEDDATDDAQTIEEVEEIQIDMVDEPVEESVEEASELPVMEEVQDEAFGAYASDELPVEEEYESQPLMAGENSVEINGDNFPDSDFRSFVENNFDNNKNGWLSDAEINAVTEILLPHDYSETVEREKCDLDLYNIDGIELFPNLKRLDCAGNINLESIDVSLNTKLEELWCYECGLGTLSVFQNTALKTLDCGGNKLKTLDVSKNVKLTELSCYNNKLKTLNLERNTALQHLYCGSNQLSTLDISKNTGLTDLDCSSNQLTSLNLSNNKQITYLSCEWNNIAELDISDLSKLAPFVTDQYKRQNEEHFVVYAQNERYNEEIEDMEWDGSILYCDRATKLITTKPAPAPAPAPASAPAPAPVIPTISAIAKKNKATVTAAPGTYCQLDLGGASGRLFKSSKKKVAVVDGNGKVTIRGAGKKKITFKVGKKKRTVTLTVKDPTIPTSVTLNVPTTTVKKGDTITLTAVLPEGTNSPIKWKSSNKRVATVSNGAITFKKPGKVTITAIAKRGKKKAKVKFKVTK